MSRSRKKHRNHQPVQTTSPHAGSAKAAASRTACAQEPGPPGSSFGARLLHARKERGISLDDVARDTRIAKRHLIALENESFSSLPRGLYGRAYVRTYAAYLSLDADSIVRDCDRTMQEQSGDAGSAAVPDQMDALRAAIKLKEGSQPQRSDVAVGAFRRPVLVSTALVMVVGGVWVGARHLSRPAGTIAVPLSTAVPAASEVVAKSGYSGEPHVAHVPAEPETQLSDLIEEIRNVSENQPSKVRHAPTTLSVNDAGVGTDVVDRELVGRAQTFPVGTRIVFWTAVIGGHRGDTINHTWFHRGRVVATVKLPVGAASWRTHSQRMLGPGTDGEWAVEAQDEQGRVLSRHEFRSVL